MQQPISYDDEYVRSLFDRMGRSYNFVNMVSSFGFSRWWREQCVQLSKIQPGDQVCDLMAGGGECWRPILRRTDALVSIDFSTVMVERQVGLRSRLSAAVDVRCENALESSLKSESLDVIVCVFGLKTLDSPGLARLATEVARVLKPGGRFSFLEISRADQWWAGPLYRWYLSSVIPTIGKLCLGDIDCYRMLGKYTNAFGSCEVVLPHFERAGLDCRLHQHFFGCATSITGRKPG